MTVGFPPAVVWPVLLLIIPSFPGSDFCALCSVKAEIWVCEIFWFVSVFEEETRNKGVFFPHIKKEDTSVFTLSMVSGGCTVNLCSCSTFNYSPYIWFVLRSNQTGQRKMIKKLLKWVPRTTNKTEFSIIIQYSVSGKRWFNQIRQILRFTIRL